MMYLHLSRIRLQCLLLEWFYLDPVSLTNNWCIMITNSQLIGSRPTGLNKFRFF